MKCARFVSFLFYQSNKLIEFVLIFLFLLKSASHTKSFPASHFPSVTLPIVSQPVSQMSFGKKPQDIEESDLKAALQSKKQAALEQRQKLGAPVQQDQTADDLWSAARQTQQSSLASTERALKLAKGSEEIGTSTVKQMKEQTEQLYRIENRMVDAEGSAIRAHSASEALNQYSKLIPINVQGKLSRRPTAIGTKVPVGGAGADQPATAGKPVSGKAPAAGEAWEYEDETERKIGKNVEQISQTLDTLQDLANEMGSEATKQKETIGRTEKLVDNTGQVLKEAEKKTQKYLAG